MKTLRVLLLLLAVSALRASDDAPKFNGVLALGDERRFVLISPSGRVSDWLRLGQSFAGYRVAAYDPKTGALELERAGERVRVFLVPEAAIVNASPDGREAESALEGLRFDNMMKGWLSSMREAHLAKVDALLKPYLRAGMEPEEIGAVRTRFAAAFRSVLESPEVKQELVRMARDSFSADELRQLAYFYNTPEAQKRSETQAEVFSPEERAALDNLNASPLGQKLRETQPRVIDRVGEFLAPRIDGLQPKLQAIMHEVTGAVP